MRNIVGTWVKLRDGGWGVEVLGATEALVGQYVPVRRRDRSTSYEEIVAVAERYADGLIFAVGKR